MELYFGASDLSEVWRKPSPDKFSPTYNLFAYIVTCLLFVSFLYTWRGRTDAEPSTAVKESARTQPVTTDPEHLSAFDVGSGSQPVDTSVTSGASQLFSSVEGAHSHTKHAQARERIVLINPPRMALTASAQQLRLQNGAAASLPGMIDSSAHVPAQPQQQARRTSGGREPIRPNVSLRMKRKTSSSKSRGPRSRSRSRSRSLRLVTQTAPPDLAQPALPAPAAAAAAYELKVQPSQPEMQLLPDG